jgi:hypothetical protein
MSQSIDEQIAVLERQLEQLRRRKLETLQKEMAALQASLLNPGAAPARRGRPPGSESGVFYPRAMRLMPKHFKRSGKGKWTRYRLK